jgi:hypothetical protein
MLNTKLVFMLKLLKLLLRSLLVVFLVLCRRLNALFEALADKQDLAVLVVDVLGLDLTPGKAAELLDDPVDR